MAMPNLALVPPPSVPRHAALVRSAPGLGRRALPRVATSLPVRLHVAGLPAGLDARTRDLSAGGLCVATPSCFPVQELRRITLFLPAGRIDLGVEGRWQAEVSGEDGILTGVRLLDVPDASLELIWDLVHTQSKSLTRWLAQQPTFEGLGFQSLVDLAHVTRLREARAGQLLYRHGVLDDSIFIVTRGEVAFEQRTPHHYKLSVGLAGPGQVVGGAGVVADLVPRETAIVSRDVSLLEISRGAFENLQETNRGLAFRLVSIVLHSHLRRIEDALHRVVGERR